MPFKTLANDRTYVLALEGRFLGNLERDRWNADVAYLQACGYRYLVVDCGEVTFIDSVGIGLIAGATRRMRNAGGDACVARVPDRLARVLKMLRLTGSVLRAYPTVAAAVEARMSPAEAAPAPAPMP